MPDPTLKKGMPEVIEAKELTASYLSLTTEYLASYSVCQTGLRVSEAMLGRATILPARLEFPATMAAAIAGRLGKLARSTRAVRRAGARYAQMEGEGMLLYGANRLLGILGLKLRRIG